jgi:hypothetical protein
MTRRFGDQMPVSQFWTHHRARTWTDLYGTMWVAVTVPSIGYVAGVALTAWHALAAEVARRDRAGGRGGEIAAALDVERVGEPRRCSGGIEYLYREKWKTTSE